MSTWSPVVKDGELIDRATWVYGRGDYGTEYASDLEDLVAKDNCSRCAIAVHHEADGFYECPKGLTMRLYSGDPIPEWDPQPTGIVCDALEPKP